MMKPFRDYKIICPDSIFEDKNINPSAKIVYTYLFSRQMAKVDMHLSIEKIAEETNMAGRSVIRQVKKLEKLGYISVSRTKGKKNLYHCLKY